MKTDLSELFFKFHDAGTKKIINMIDIDQHYILSPRLQETARTLQLRRLSK